MTRKRTDLDYFFFRVIRVLLFNVKKGTTKVAINTKGILEINFVLFVYFVVPFLAGSVGVLMFHVFSVVCR